MCVSPLQLAELFNQFRELDHGIPQRELVEFFTEKPEFSGGKCSRIFPGTDISAGADEEDKKDKWFTEMLRGALQQAPLPHTHTLITHTSLRMF